MLSKLIDSLYFKLRYAIWGPAVPFEDGTVIPRGRPDEDRTDGSGLFYYTLDFGDDGTVNEFHTTLKAEGLPLP
jgi:hypothetical protein